MSRVVLWKENHSKETRCKFILILIVIEIFKVFDVVSTYLTVPTNVAIITVSEINTPPHFNTFPWSELEYSFLPNKVAVSRRYVELCLI